MSAARPTVRRRVDAEHAGLRLDVFLARQPEVGSRRAAKQLIVRGAVSVGRAEPKPRLELAVGDEVAFVPAEPPGAEIDAVLRAAEPLRVLFDDPYLLVIDKRPGIPSHPPEGPAGHRVASVAGLAEARWGPLPRLGGDDRPGVVHRLDKDTSGVMVLVKNAEAFHFVQAQFKARTVEKEYHCLCHGVARFDSDWIEGAIGRHPTRPERMVVCRDGGRQATTYYEVIERFDGYTYFRCMPKTGRTHQIRVHMASIGHSLVGDRTYCHRSQANAALPAECPPAVRQCLHARHLRLLHPFGRERLELSAPIPDDIRRIVDWLRIHRPARSVG